MNFYGLTTNGVEKLSNFICSSTSLHRIVLHLTDRKLSRFGKTPHFLDPILKALFVSHSLCQVDLNFGHKILAELIGTDKLDRVDVLIEDIDRLYDFVTLLQRKRMSDSFILTINHNKYGRYKHSLKCLGNAVRRAPKQIGHRRSSSLPQCKHYNSAEPSKGIMWSKQRNLSKCCPNIFYIIVYSVNFVMHWI